MCREYAIPVNLDGHGRQSGGAYGGGQALGHPDGFLDLAIGQGAHVIRTEVAQVDDPGQRQKQTYPDDATQAGPTRMPRLHHHRRRRRPAVA